MWSFTLYRSFLSVERVACLPPSPDPGLTEARLPPFHPGSSRAGGSWRVGGPFEICRASLHKSENPTTTEDQGDASSEPLVNSSAMR